MAGKVLIVSTSAKDTTWGKPTGVWLEELAEPYYVFSEAGYEVDIATIKGGKPPIDATSLADDAQTDKTRAFSSDSSIQSKLESAPAVSSITDAAATYEAVFLPGGHGTCFDFDDSGLTKIIESLLAANKVVATVCHGPTALVTAKTADGQPLVKGKNVTGFSDEEEGMVGLADKVPFLLESKLRELGAHYTKGDAWASYVVVDGRLVTGQNPKSSKLTAERALQLLSK